MWRTEQLLCRHWNLPADYVQRELEWIEFYPLLWICFEQEEMARRRAWMGKPEDYKRIFPLPGDDAPPAEMKGADIGAQMEALGSALGGMGNRVSLQAMAEWRPDRVQAVYTAPDGTLVDAEGRPIDQGTRVFVPVAQQPGDAPPATAGLPPMLADALRIGGRR
jgi:hypothetical protein